MFHFPTFPPHSLCVQLRVTRPPKGTQRGFPIRTSSDQAFGYQLPEAYRRFLRPSSAPNAKASTVRPEKLSHTKKPRQHTTPTNHNRPAGIMHKIRCSRPLYSSQPTTQPPPTPTQTAGTRSSRNKAYCLKTQQRAKHTPPGHRQPFHTPEPPQGGTPGSYSPPAPEPGAIH